MRVSNEYRKNLAGAAGLCVVPTRRDYMGFAVILRAVNFDTGMKKGEIRIFN